MRVINQPHFDLNTSHGKEIFELAKANNVSVFFEAAVASGTPIISTLIRDLSAANIQSIRAIINGTSNFILTEMDENKSAFFSKTSSSNCLKMHHNKVLGSILM